MTNTEINLFDAAGASLVVALAIAFHKPVIVWIILALFSLHEVFSF